MAEFMERQIYTFYTIIVPSFNRQEEIRELLSSVEKLDFPRDRFELLIVDDGSTDNTMEYLWEYHKNAKFKLRFVDQENLGPGAARNTGMKNARGDFFIFIDSDCMVPPHWLKTIDEELNSDTSEACAFGGPDSYHESFSPLLKAINYSMTSFITTGNACSGAN